MIKQKNRRFRAVLMGICMGLGWLAGFVTWDSTAFADSAAAGPARYIYVDAASTGLNNGSSWTDAFTSLQDGLVFATQNPSIEEIRVAGGTYRPAEPDGDKNLSFSLMNGVKIMGGFAGVSGSDPSERKPNFWLTILSGDLNGNDGDDFTNINDNSRCVVTGSNTNSTAVLDGFIITGGKAEMGAGMIIQNGNPTLTECIFSKNWAAAGAGGLYSQQSDPTLVRCRFENNFCGYTGGAGMHNDASNPRLYDCIFINNAVVSTGLGGGMYNGNGSEPILYNCSFISNTAGVQDDTGSSQFSGGGGMFNQGSSPILVGCLFDSNITANNRGGAINHYDGGHLTLINCTFWSNASLNNLGGGLYLYTGSLSATNCIFWNNHDAAGTGQSSQILNITENLEINYCCVQGWDNTLPGTGNIGADPRFMNPAGADNIIGTLDDNLRIEPGSPAADAGDSTAVPADLAVDLEGDDRIKDDPAAPDTGIALNGLVVDMGIYEGPKQGFVVNSESLSVAEGASQALTITLTQPPTEEITVVVALISNDLDLQIQNGHTWQVNPDNYNQPHEVVITAAEDDDNITGTGRIMIMAPEIHTRTLDIMEQENEPEPDVIFVDASPSGGQNGWSWDSAFNDLQHALNAARSNPFAKEIRVAGGTYKPAGPVSDRDIAFRLIKGVALRGGYAGYGAANPDERNPDKYLSILSGDLNGNDMDYSDPSQLLSNLERADNSIHVIVVDFPDRSGDLTILDGFTIANGNADVEYGDYRDSGRRGGGLYMDLYDHASIVIRNCIFRNNTALSKGGGLYKDYDYNTVTFEQCDFINNACAHNGGGAQGIRRMSHCRFLNNYAGENGGGLYPTNDADCVISNCLFSGNRSHGDGGAIHFGDDNHFYLYNCTLAGNRAGGLGGGVYYSYSLADLHNTILTDNTDSAGSGFGAQYYNANAYGRNLYHCCITGLELPDFYGNIPGPARFLAGAGVDGRWGTADDDMRLGEFSPCLDAGTNYFVPEGLNSDLAGQARISNQTVDIGAYEFRRPEGWYPYQLVLLDGQEADSSRARAINDNGVIVGWSFDYNTGAKLFDSSGGMNNIHLGTLGGRTSDAYGLNNLNQIVGVSQTADEGHIYHATLFDATGEDNNIDLGGLGGDSSYAYDINDSGTIVGTAIMGQGAINWRATLFQPGGVNINLGNLTDNSNFRDSGARAINNQGQIVGWAYAGETTITTHAVLFDATGNGNNIDLTPGNSGSEAFDINDDGLVVGTSWICNGATLFDTSGAGRHVALGALPGGSASVATAINNPGQIVGSCFIPHPVNPGYDPVSRPVLFDATGHGHNIDLNQSIDPELGWELWEATDINDQGWIVGHGYNPVGEYRAFLLVPQREIQQLVAHWKLDETQGSIALDSAGNHDGLLIGGPQWEPCDKLAGTLSFDGVNDYVACGNSSTYDITLAITLTAWIRAESFTRNFQAIITKGDSAWRLQRNGATDCLVFGCSGVDVAAEPGSPWGSLRGTVPVNDGQWHHVACVYDGSIMYLYIDGQLDVSSPAAGKINTNDYPVLIGENAQQPGRHWNGQLADVRVYNYPLTAQEIARIGRFATTMYVDGSAAGDNDGSNWQNAFVYLKDALALAIPGDEIRVAQGTYRPGYSQFGNNLSREESFVLVDGIALKGGYAGGQASDPDERDFAQYQTILSGDLTDDDDGDLTDYSRLTNSYHVVTGSDTGPDTLLEGFIIVAGYAYENKATRHDNGGGLYNDNAFLTIKSCRFINNLAANEGGGGGGGIYNRYSDPVIIDCEFLQNFYHYADDDGGGAICNYKSHPVISGCLFKKNQSSGHGGAIYDKSSHPVITDCQFIDNSAARSGGAVNFEYDTTTLERCLFQNNQANQDGGAINCERSSLTLTDCVLSGNSARWSGGGIQCDYKDQLLLTHCILEGNRASIYFGGGLYQYHGNAKLVNCTWYGNSSNTGGGIYNRETTMDLLNCILWQNSAASGPGLYLAFYENPCPVTVEYCDIQGGLSGIEVEPGRALIWQPGNLDIDPLFVKPGSQGDACWMSGDYHLQSNGYYWDTLSKTWKYGDFTSRAIDAGHPGMPLGKERLTIPNEPFRQRLSNLRINMGAYGGTDQASAPPHDWALAADVNNDGIVDLGDFTASANEWLESSSPSTGDFNRDGRFDLDDLAQFVNQWLAHTSWYH